MPNTPQIIERIRQLLAVGRLEDALKELLQWANSVSDDYAINQTTLWSARYYQGSTSYSQGVIIKEIFDRECWEIQYGLQQLLTQLETVAAPVPMRSSREKGRFVHNIPSKMAIDKPTRCTVRIAKNDQLLLEQFPLNEDTKPEDVTISKAMSVELVDLYGGEAFHIDSISSRDQIVLDDDFTQWIFIVKPLKEGQYTLIIKISIIEMVDGVERRREVTMDKPVNVTAIDQDYFNATATSTWTTTNFMVHLQEPRRAWLPLLFVNKKTGEISYKAIAAFFTTIGVVGYVLYRLLSVSPEKTEIGIESILEINSDLISPKVFVNNKVIEGWTANSDTSEITLPPLMQGKYSVAVIGENGRCSGLINLSADTTRFNLNCVVSGVPSMLRKSFNVSIVTPFNNPRLTIDGKLASIPINRVGVNSYHSTTSLSRGNHVISVADPANQYECIDMEQSVTISSDTSINFLCSVIGKPTYNIRVIIRDPIGSKNLKGLHLVMDNSMLKVIPQKESPSGVVFAVPGVSGGNHTFRVTGLDSTYACSDKSINIKSNLEFQLDCYGPGFIVILTIPNRINEKPGHFLNGFKIGINMDGRNQAVKPIENANELRFIISNVPRGRHTFSVLGLERTNFVCTPLEIDVQANYQTVKFNCGNSID